MTPLSYPGWRIAGLVLAAGIIFFLDTQSPTALHQLWLPLALAVAAFMMTQALMAVAFACLVLATINADLSVQHWIPSLAYPAVAVISGFVCLVIMTRRFRQRIAETHDARWAHRRDKKS